ncbi:hypothetical protein HRbin23_00920 [bacterium HR23]|nr:hypothetical protein HRbin23_00920 [bacterium HR23]
MFWFQACPRCQGDLFRTQDLYGSYIACIQCGYILTEGEERALEHAEGQDLPSQEPSLAR